MTAARAQEHSARFGGTVDHGLRFWSRWLVASGVIVLVFGLALVVVAQPMQGVFESLYFTSRTGLVLDTEAASYTAFLQGVLGAVMVGWATLLIFLGRGPFRQAEPWAWNMIAASLGAWFFSDTAFSLVTGYWQNAVLNVGLCALFALPLAATYRRLHPPRA